MATQRFGRWIYLQQSKYYLDHLQAASTAVPFFTMQTHGKNTADFVFQVFESRVHKGYPLLSLLISQGGSSSLLATAGHSADGRNVALWDTLLPQRKACVTAFKYVLLISGWCLSNIVFGSWDGVYVTQCKLKGDPVSLLLSLRTLIGWLRSGFVWYGMVWEGLVGWQVLTCGDESNMSWYGIGWYERALSVVKFSCMGRNLTCHDME